LEIAQNHFIVKRYSLLGFIIAPLRLSGDEAPSGLSIAGALMDTQGMNITKNIGMLLLAIYLIAVGILTLTGLGIGIITGVLALLAGIFILIGR